MPISPIEASAGKHTLHRATAAEIVMPTMRSGGSRSSTLVATCDSAPTSHVDQWKGNRRRRSTDASNITLPVRATCCSSIRRQLRASTVFGRSESSSQQKMRAGSSPIDESTRVSGYSALNEGIIMLPITAKPLTSRSEPRALLKKEKSIRYSPP